MKLRKVTAASAAALVLALTATACGGDSKDDDTSSSASAGSGGGGKIKVGIKYDQPGLGLKQPDGSFAGFDVDVATYVAKELGYKPNQITFVETKSADRENALGWNDAGKTGTKAECLAYIEEVWTDMRPLSLRKKMAEAGS